MNHGTIGSHGTYERDETDVCGIHLSEATLLEKLFSFKMRGVGYAFFCNSVTTYVICDCLRIQDVLSSSSAMVLYFSSQQPTVTNR